RSRRFTLSLRDIAAPRSTVHTCIRQSGSDESNGADGVVVTRDRIVDQARVAIAVGDGNDRDTKLTRLRNGYLLLSRIDDEHGRGHRSHALDASDVLLEA